MQVKSESFVVRDYEGREIVSQVLPISDVQLSLSKFFVTSYLGVTVRDAPNYWLAFRASVPPLGFSTYTVSGVKGMISFLILTLHNSVAIVCW